MQLTLYKLIGCDDFKIDKSSYITPVIALQGDIKEDCDISSPVITCNCPQSQSNENIIDFNYCRIYELNRYYFIDKIVFGMNNIITIYCTSDVLYSFMNTPSGVTSHWYINSLYCTRRTNGNLLIQDNERSYKYNKVVTDITSSIPIPSGTPRMNFAVTGWYRSSMRVVISCLTTYPFSTRDIMLPKGSVASLGVYPSLDETSIAERFSTMYYVISLRSLASLLDQIANNDTIKSFIKSIVLLPYEPDYQDYWLSDDEEPQQQKIKGVWIGDNQSAINLPDYTGFLIKGNYDRFIKEYRDIPSATSYLDYNPYTQIKMYIPYKDYIELDLESVRGCRLALIYYVNYDDGTSDVILYNTTNNKIEYQSTCQLGIKIGISSTNQLEITNQKIQLGITTAISTIASIVGIMSANPMIAMGGAMGVASASANYITKSNALLVTGETAISSGNVGVINPQNVNFIQIKQQPIITSSTDETTYANDKGLPYNNYLSINDATSGEYLVFDDDNVPMDNRMTKQEFNTLIGLLKKGVRK